MQDKLGKRNFHENGKKLYELPTDTIKNTSEKLTKTITETSIKNNKGISDVKEKVSELINDTGIIAPYLACSLVNLFIPENKSQFKLKKDLNSTRMNDFLMNTSLPVTLYSIFLTSTDTNRSFKLNGDLLKTMTKYKLNVDHSNSQDRKLIFEFGKELKFDFQRVGRTSTRDRSL